MWEKELKMIEGLGKLYPEFEEGNRLSIIYERFDEDKWDKAYWVFLLCKYHLNRRIPSLENFIRKTGISDYVWKCYSYHFRIK